MMQKITIRICVIESIDCVKVSETDDSPDLLSRSHRYGLCQKR